MQRIPHKTVLCADRDPPWINSNIKGLIQETNIAKKCYLRNNKDIQLFQRFQCMQNLLTATIAQKKKKKKFYSQLSTKLMDRTVSPKAYRSILKTFLYNKKHLAFHQFITIAVTLLILKRMFKISTNSLLSNAH